MRWLLWDRRRWRRCTNLETFFENVVRIWVTCVLKLAFYNNFVGNCLVNTLRVKDKIDLIHYFQRSTHYTIRCPQRTKKITGIKVNIYSHLYHLLSLVRLTKTTVISRDGKSWRRNVIHQLPLFFFFFD